MVRKVLQYYQIFCNLSLDVVLGVCCNMLPLPYCFGTHVSIGWILGLPAATWLVYLLDHVLDSWNNPEANSERHEFVRSNLKQILGLMFILFTLCCYLLITYYTPILFASAITVVFFCMIFFVLTNLRNPVFRYFYNKELMVACVYASALYLPVGLENPYSLTWLGFFSCLMLITYINLLMMSVIDLPIDTQQHQFSWVMMIGQKRATHLLHIILVFTTGLAISLCVITDSCMRNLAATYALMVIAHTILYAYNTSIQDIRKWSEAVFWLPILAWLFC